MQSLKVWQLDPAAFVPFYVRPLCAALQAAGADVQFLSTVNIYEKADVVPAFEEAYYFSLLQSRFLQPLNRTQKVRRMARGLHYLFDQGWLLRRAAIQQPHIVHVHWGLVPAWDKIIWRSWQQQGVKIVYTIHDLVPNHLPATAASRYFAFYDQADALIIHSERNQADLLAWVERVLPAHRASLSNKLHVIPMGNLYPEPAVLSQTAARQKLGLDDQRPVLLYLGNIKAYKGVPQLLAAFQQLQAQGIDAQLLIAGHVSPDYPGGEGGLHKVADDNPDIRLDLRFIPDEDIPTYFAAANGIVLPYLYGTQSAVALTALTQGCPIVATDIGGLGDVVMDDQTGWLVPPQDVDKLAEAMSKVVTLAPEKAAIMREFARQLARDKYSWASIAQKTLALYQEVLG